MQIDPIALFESALKLDRRKSAFGFYGFLIFALSIYLWNYISDVGIPFWAVPAYLLVFCVLIAGFTQINGVLKHVLSWAVVTLFFVWLSALITQVVTQSFFTPPLATAICMVKPFEDRCAFITAGAALQPMPPPVFPAPDASAALTPPLAPAIAPDAAITRSVTLAPRPPVAPEPVLVQATVPGSNQVFIQFAVLSRDDVVDAASRLTALGWNVQGAASGGERLSAATGLMEVRFFFAEDATGAALLAQNLQDSRPGRPQVGVRDLSGTDLAKSVSPGHFEIWMSQ